MSAHTPGLWRVSVKPHNDHHVEVAAGEEDIATLRGPNRVADAQIMAAAPDLLEALLLAAGHLLCFQRETIRAPRKGCPCITCAAATAAIAAIAKATK